MLVDRLQALILSLLRPGFIRCIFPMRKMACCIALGLPVMPIVTLAQLAPAATGTLITGPVSAQTKISGDKAETGALWTQLKPNEQQILAPLKTLWPTLSAGHKNKWISLADRFEKMKPEERLRVTQ
jgi:hypothetical protein